MCLLLGCYLWKDGTKSPKAAFQWLCACRWDTIYTRMGRNPSRLRSSGYMLTAWIPFTKGWGGIHQGSVPVAICLLLGYHLRKDGIKPRLRSSDYVIVLWYHLLRTKGWGVIIPRLRSSDFVQVAETPFTNGWGGITPRFRSSDCAYCEILFTQGWGGITQRLCSNDDVHVTEIPFMKGCRGITQDSCRNYK